MSITVALLAYKEEENLRVLLPKIRSFMDSTGEEYEILVVDSAEPLDDTAQVCEENGARYVNQEEPYFAGAFRTAIRHAKGDRFLILDADCSHDPEALPRIVKRFDETGADLVIGSRYVEGGVSNDSRSSRVMSGLLNGMFRKALGVTARDISTDYRMYRTAALRRISLACERYDVLQEVILKLKMDKGGAIRIEEVPIEFSKRAYGESKRQLVLFIEHYARTIVWLTTERLMYEREGFSEDLDERSARVALNVMRAGAGLAGVAAGGAAFAVTRRFGNPVATASGAAVALLVAAMLGKAFDLGRQSE